MIETEMDEFHEKQRSGHLMSGGFCRREKEVPNEHDSANDQESYDSQETAGHHDQKWESGARQRE
jgi:hypothetical protein